MMDHWRIYTLPQLKSKVSNLSGCWILVGRVPYLVGGWRVLRRSGDNMHRDCGARIYYLDAGWLAGWVSHVVLHHSWYTLQVHTYRQNGVFSSNPQHHTWLPVRDFVPNFTTQPTVHPLVHWDQGGSLFQDMGGQLSQYRPHHSQHHYPKFISWRIAWMFSTWNIHSRL